MFRCSPQLWTPSNILAPLVDRQPEIETSAMNPKNPLALVDIVLRDNNPPAFLCDRSIATFSFHGGGGIVRTIVWFVWYPIGLACFNQSSNFMIMARLWGVFADDGLGSLGQGAPNTIRRKCTSSIFGTTMRRLDDLRKSPDV